MESRISRLRGERGGEYIELHGRGTHPRPQSRGFREKEAMTDRARKQGALCTAGLAAFPINPVDETLLLDLAHDAVINETVNRYLASGTLL